MTHESPLPSLDDIVRAIEADVAHAAGAAISRWNQSAELEAHGVFLGYATDPVLRIVVSPREWDHLAPQTKTEIEVRYV